MIKIGDTVKVIDTTMHYGERKEFIPVGTICKVVRIELTEEGNTVGIIPESNLPYDGYSDFLYLESEVEKGHMEWIKDE